MIVKPKRVLWPTDFSRLSLHGALYARGLRELFDAELKSKGFKKAVKKTPVKAVFIYRVAEGGFVVKFLKGRGSGSIST